MESIFKKELKNLFFTKVILKSKKHKIENEKFEKIKIKNTIYFNTIKITCSKNIEEFFNLFGKNKIYVKEPIEVYPFNIECAIETLILYNQNVPEIVLSALENGKQDTLI